MEAHPCKLCIELSFTFINSQSIFDLFCFSYIFYIRHFAITLEKSIKKELIMGGNLSTQTTIMERFKSNIVSKHNVV